MPEVGEILEGKVTGIMKYGAFVSLEGGGSGLVHISEIADSYVQEVREHLTEGQAVRVKVIGTDEKGKLRLSIKKAQPDAERPRTARPPRPEGSFRPASRPGMASPRPAPGAAVKPAAAPAYAGAPEGVSTLEPTANAQFEDRLKSFLADSNSRMSDLKHQADRKSGSRGRKR